MLNKVMLIGNLGKDPEVRRLESGATVARFSIATNERYKDKTGNPQTVTEWHDVVMWRNLAELAEKLLVKGRLVYVEGKLSTRKYTDQNGNERRITEVIANNFQILDRKDSMDGNSSGNSSISQNSSAQDVPSNRPSSNMNTGSNNEEDDDLPF